VLPLIRRLMPKLDQPPEVTCQPLLEGLSRLTVQRLSPMFTPMAFAAGETIFTQGAPAERLFVLIAGEVDLRLNAEDGGCLTIAVVRPLGVFGWSAALGRERYTSGAVAVTASQTEALDGRALRGLVRTEPRLGRLLLGRLALAHAGRVPAGDPALRVPPALVARLIQAGIANATRIP
jgi:CRP-like cAMP-binding protein